jgi:cell wall-associated NlpC family hydrolase
MSFSTLLKTTAMGDPVLEDLARTIDISDRDAQQRGLVDTKGSVQRVSLAGSGNAMNVIGFAQSQLGKPYVFGSGPDTASFDCSDLIQWAYKQAGINLPRTTFEQIHVGRSVKWADLQPGDLIFPTGHHVVMYVGHGKVIAAPHTGTVVQYQPVSSFSNPVAIRRVL